MNKIITSNLEINNWLAQLQDNVDLWITDPPYPFENQNGTKRFKHIDGQDLMYSRMEWKDLENIFDQMYQKTSAGGRSYIFCNRDGLFATKENLEKVGWKFRNLLVWDKKVMGMGYHWRNQAEYICYASKGAVKKYVKNQPNIFSFKKPTDKDAIPAINYSPTGISPKPYQIWEKIMLAQLGEGEIVADPFSGSAPLNAAILMNQDIQNRLGKAYVNIY